MEQGPQEISNERGERADLLPKEHSIIFGEVVCEFVTILRYYLLLSGLMIWAAKKCCEMDKRED